MMTTANTLPNCSVRARTSRRSLGQNLAYFFMATPGLVLLFVFSYIPMFRTVIAFMDYRASRGVFGSRWIGLKNFQFPFTSSVLHLAKGL